MTCARNRTKESEKWKLTWSGMCVCVRETKRYARGQPVKRGRETHSSVFLSRAHAFDKLLFFTLSFSLSLSLFLSMLFRFSFFLSLALRSLVYFRTPCARYRVCYRTYTYLYFFLLCNTKLIVHSETYTCVFYFSLNSFTHGEALLHI